MECFEELTLEDIPVSYINLEKDTFRNKTMQALLSNFKDVKRINAIEAGQFTRSRAIAKSHEKALKSRGEGPCIVLEDDCIVYEYRSKILVPQDADLVFLGLWENCQKEVQLSNGIFKVTATVGAHAILYLSEKSKAFMYEVFNTCYETGHWHDFHMMQNLRTINAYALNIPIFAQSSQRKSTWISV